MTRHTMRQYLLIAGHHLISYGIIHSIIDNYSKILHFFIIGAVAFSKQLGARRTPCGKDLWLDSPQILAHLLSCYYVHRDWQPHKVV